MEIDSSFGKFIKSHRNKKTSFRETVLFLSFIQHLNTRIHICNQIKFSCLPHLPLLCMEHCAWFSKTKPAGPLGLGGSSWPRYMSLSCHKACKRSLILKPGHGEVMEKSWKKY